MSSFADISIRFRADLKQFSSQMQNAERSVQQFGKKMTSVGKSLSAGISLPLIGIGALSVKTFADFEQSLAKVQAVSGATGQQMQALRKNAEDLGASTRFAASEVAGLQLNLSKLGFNPDEIIKSTDAILSLALATGEDLGQSATVAASTIRGFGLDVSEAGRVADVMAASFSASALDLGKFEVAMSTVAPVAANAGKSIEEVTGLLSVLVNAGIDASTAGTGLRNIFLDTAKSGITFEEAMDKINNSTNKSVTALDMFGKRGATVATVLANNADQAKDFAAQYKNAEGSAKKMAAIMDNTLQGSFARLKSATESAAIAIGDQMAPFVRALTDRLSDLVSKFKELEPSTQRIIVVVGALAAAVGPLLISIGFLATNVIPGLISSLTALRLAVAANPLGALLTVAATVTAAFVLLNKTKSETTVIARTLSTVSKQAAVSLASEKSQLDSLLKVARDETKSKQERLDAIKALNEISPEYLGNLSLEEINTNNATTAVNNYIDAINKKALAQAAASKKQELFAKRIELESKALGASSTFVDELSDKFFGLFGVDTFRPQGIEDLNRYLQENIELGKLTADGADFIRAAYSKSIAIREKDLSLIDKQIDALDKYVDVSSAAGSGDVFTNSIQDAIDASIATGERPKVKAVLEIESLGSQGLARTTQELTQQLTAFENLRRQFVEGTLEYDLLTQKIDFVNDSLEQLKNNFQGELMGDEFLNTEALDALAAKMEYLRELGVLVGDEVSAAFENFSGRFVDALGLAKDGMEGFVSGLVQTVMKLIGMMLSQSISQAIAGATASGTATGPKAVFTTPAFIATAVGGVLSAFASIPKFADGGIVSGPTLGLMGEYSGASTNPEVIAPLNKLKSLLGDVGGKVFIPNMVLKGEDLVVSFNRTNNRNNRLR
jgi:hypothetical protein